jgi:hypothetical protein
MTKTVVLFLCCIFIFLSNQVSANELIVVSGDSSKNSKRWKDEVFMEYNLSAIGKTMPGKIIIIKGDKFPPWFVKAKDAGRIGQIVGTPTFIVWDEVRNMEVGRLEGYTVKSKFYSDLNDALLQINQGLQPGRREGSEGHKEEGSGGHKEEGPAKYKEEGSSMGVNPPQNELKGISPNIMDHIYKTPEEAKRISVLLGFGGEIHNHKTSQGTIYMPGPTM